MSVLIEGRGGLCWSLIPIRSCVGLEFALYCHLCILKPFDEGPWDHCVSGEHHCFSEAALHRNIHQESRRTLPGSQCGTAEASQRWRLLTKTFSLPYKPGISHWGFFFQGVRGLLQCFMVLSIKVCHVNQSWFQFFCQMPITLKKSFQN